MIAGFASLEQAGGRPRRVIGIDASAKIAETRDQVARIARSTASLIGLERDLLDDETSVLEGVILDPVYEGKSMAGLIDLVNDGDIPRDATVLYAHLGGQPALNAYSGLFTHTHSLTH